MILKRLAVLILAVVLLFSAMPIAGAAANTGVINAQDVNLRSGAGTHTSSILKMDKGTQVVVNGVSGNWVSVTYGKHAGYVYSDYVDGPQAKANADPTLRYGSKGKEVTDLQNGLIQLGYLDYWATGQFGSLTREAVIKFQRDHNIIVDGIAGPQTKQKLKEETSAASGEAAILKMGSQGQQVSQVQQALKDIQYFDHAVTGNFGTVTHNAVVKFQSDRKLTVDGIVGAKTQMELMGRTMEKQVKTGMKVELLSWNNEADALYARGSTAVITDVKTGLKFNALRFGGRLHADAEPVTKADTAIMKQISGGSWSWDRRPVLVSIGGRTIAASMHTMPHMVDPIKGNDFPGHFCIHFLDSRVHATNRACGRHQDAVQEAFKAGNR
ncbi:MAG: peptidoglycan-binding protein [Christensenellales bacterium]|jgi:peptidoglycan hydrolase-like protein with peptidoglycan-binding domain